MSLKIKQQHEFLLFLPSACLLFFLLRNNKKKKKKKKNTGDLNPPVVQFCLALALALALLSPPFQLLLPRAIWYFLVF